MQPQTAPKTTLPEWVPADIRLYLDYTKGGVTLHSLAREAGAHASTVLRRVRKCEMRRDDPLIDAAISDLERMTVQANPKEYPMQPESLCPTIGDEIKTDALIAIDDNLLQAEARRVLRKLLEPASVLVISADLPRAVVLRQTDGQTQKLGVVDRKMAEAFAIKDWISCHQKGRVSSYRITTAGRSALRRMIDGQRATGDGLADSASAFAAQHRDMAERLVGEGGRTRRLRFNMAESPVAAMGRRRDKDGELFLTPDLVAVAERLREDFELAQMGPRVAQNWDRFLTGGARGDFRSGSGAGGSERARARVAAALADLGFGLGDVALRVCCFLEGIEEAERRMNWAARSGKIVLRIALQRLMRHYAEVDEGRPRTIG